MDWQHQTHRRAALVFDQIAQARRLAENAVRNQWPDAPDDIDAFLDGMPYMALLDKLYSEDFQISRLMDRSDLIFHAEGPAAADAMPQLKAINWLCAGVDRNLRRLAEAVLQMHSDVAAKLAGAIDLRLTGMAPGSLYLGFSVVPPTETLPGMAAGEEEPAFVMVRDAIRGLPTVPRFIRNEDIDNDILEAIPDPALRDASLTASYHLAPTGRMGIDTIEIGRPDSKSAVLSQRERGVLRDIAMKRPLMRNRHHGVFVGELREVDLDANRFHLRNIPDIGNLRCAMVLNVDHIRPLIGGGIRVEGVYETDGHDRPRLMEVHKIEPYQMQQSL